MRVHTFDPLEHIRDIHQILVSDKKRIGFLFGAGTSYATGIDSVCVPAVKEMTARIVGEIELDNPSFGAAIRQIQAEIQDDKASFNVETLLTSIETKGTVIGGGKLNGLDAAGFTELTKTVRQKIVQIVSVHEKIERKDIRRLAHAKLSNWISRARRTYPAEIFTTNYDYLLEIALEDASIPFFDGFSGSHEPFFCPEAVEDMKAYRDLVKLWKMHGSLGWVQREYDKAVIRHEVKDAYYLIFPSLLKYRTAKKQPYVALIDRLCSFLQEDDAVLFTCGFSFGDSHINERIVTSLRRGSNSHVYALLYDEQREGDNTLSYGLTDEENGLRKMATWETGGKLSVYGVRHAVIGGRFGQWKLSAEPKVSDTIRLNEYFDEDGATPADGPGEHKGDEHWHGTGRLLLPDFRRLTTFLNGLCPSAEQSSPLPPR